MTTQQPQVDWNTAQPIQPQVDWSTATPVSSQTQSSPGVWDALTSNWHSNTDELPNPDNSALIGAQNVARGAARGIGHLLVHPLATIEGTPALSAPTPMATGNSADAVQQANQQAVQQGAQNAQAQVQAAAQHPAYTAGQVAGPMLLGEGLKAGITEVPGEISNSVSALDFNARKQAAGALLQSVGEDANKVPVELENSSDAALNLMDWQKKTNLGPTLNKFLNRVTSPKQGPLTYGEARDYYSLLGNMSANEKMSLPPAVMRDVNGMLAGLKTDIGNAADTVGRAANYYQGMGDYAKAAKYQGWVDSAKDAATSQAVKYAVGGGTAYGLWKWLNGNSK